MNRSFRAEETERAVLRSVLDAVKDREELIRGAEEDFEARSALLLGSGAPDAEDLLRRMDAIEFERMEYVRQRARSRLDDAALDALLSEADAEKARLEKMLEEHEDREKRVGDLEKVRDRTISLIRQGRWHELGITAPTARRERYREIGLTATACRDGSVVLSWGIGKEAVVGTEAASSSSDSLCAPMPKVVLRLQLQNSKAEC
jgi:hypothetical protein